MSWRKISLWFAFGFLALTVLVVSWLWTTDLGVFKPRIERWVTDRTGREFAIDGRLNVDFGSQSVVIAEGIRFENADWARDGQMVEIGHIEVRIDTWSLIKGPFKIELVDLRDVQVELERNLEGEPNWALPARESRPDDRQESSVDGPGFLVRQINVDRARLVYVSPERTGPLDLRIEKLHQQHKDDDFLELTLEAILGERNIDLRATVGTWTALLDQKEIEYEFEGQFDTFSVASEGHIDDLVAPRRPSLNFAAKGPDVNDLLRLLEIDARGAGDIDLSASLMPVDNGPLVLNIDGHMGQAEVAATGSVSDLRDLEQIDFDLQSSGPDLSRILKVFGVYQMGESPFAVDVKAKRQGPMLVVEHAHVELADAGLDLQARLPKFPGFDDGEAHLQIAGSDLARFRKLMQLPGAATGAFSADIDLNVTPDSGEIVQIEIVTTLGRLDVQARLGDAPDYIGSEIQFALNIDSLARFAGAYGLAELPDNPAAVNGAIAVLEEGVRTRGPVSIQIDRISAQVDGLITLAPGSEGSDLSFALSGPDLAELVAAFASSDAVPPQPYDVRGNLQVQRGGYRLQNVTGNVGRSSFDLDGLLSLVAGLNGSYVEFKSTGPAFEEVIDHIGMLDVQPGQYALTGGLSFAKDRIKFNDIKLVRERGQIDANLDLALPTSIRDATFDVHASGGDFQVLLGKLSVFEVDEAPFSINLRGDLRDRKVSLEVADIRIGEASLVARGDLDFSKQSTTTHFAFDANVPKLGQLGLFAGKRLRDQGLSVKAIVGGGGGTITIDDLNAKLGDNEIHGSFQFQIGEIPKLVIAVTADTLVFPPLMDQKEAENVPVPVPVPVADAQGDRLIPDIDVPFDKMQKLDATVDLRIGELQRDSLLLRDITVQAELRAGALYIRRAEFAAPAGALSARAALEPLDGSGRATLAIVANNFALGIPRINADLGRKSDIKINLEASGTNLRSVAGNANGEIYVNASGGDVPNIAALQKFYGDALQELLATVNPFSKSSSVAKLDCIIIPLDIRDGQIKTAPTAFVSTDMIQIVSESSIDLKSEKINVSLRTTPRKGITISAGEIFNPYVKIVGTLAAPRLAVNEQGMLITGGAAVATGGLSILAKSAWDRLSRESDPCGAATKQSIALLSDRFPDLPEPTGN